MLVIQFVIMELCQIPTHHYGKVIIVSSKLPQERRAAIQGTTWIDGTVTLDQNVGTLYKNVNSSIKKKSLPSDEHLPPNKLIGAVLSTIVRNDFLNDDNNFTILRKKLNNNTKSFTGVFQLYQAYFQGKPEDEWPTKLIIYKSLKTKRNLMVHCDPSFRGVPRYDRVSIKGTTVEEQGNKPKIIFAEVYCFVRIIWPGHR